jgi:hypothetical protein
MKFETFWKEYSFFTNPVIKYMGYPTEIDITLPIFRVREYDNFELCKEELRYPAKENCTRIGRANVPYYPVFYGSFSSECAINEVKKNSTEKNQYVLSEWNWNRDAKISCILFSNRNNNFEFILGRHNIRSIEEYINLAIEKGKNIQKDSLQGSMLEKMNEISDFFLNEDDYFGSAIVAYDHLYRTRLSESMITIDAIIYISSSRDGINIAIHPSIVDKYLNLVNFRLIKL